ncbi:von Willebrand factor type A domain protein [Symmachiella dynata]|uniref:VIT domain-containing protein n=1 Tax=Symmachiella dynata TaxID=2527995 RepID=UPI001188967D|nr:VIT domain-containing protein [Symmachiella dynata]QDT49767.1 von Willebrand factor type A domain protein [Symmachiella dynata]
MLRYRSLPFIVGLICLFASASANAQVIVINPKRDRVASPSPRPIRQDYEIKSVDIQADIRDQAAEVQVSQVFANKSSRTLQATLFFPLPDEATISGLTLIVDGKELPGRLLPKDEARRIYEDIVRRSQDPALLEYMGRGLFRTSVFPVPPNAQRKVEIRYSQLLKKSDGLVDFSLPLGNSKHSTKPIKQLNLTVRVQANEGIKTIYSPSHDVNIERPESTRAVCKTTLTDVAAADDFRLLFGTESGPVGMNVISYRPDKSQDGYFLLLAAPEIAAADAQAVPKTVVFVVDRSGSMSGQKFEQVRKALRFVLDRLGPEDLFNIVAYDSKVDAFRPELQRADEATIAQARGFVDGLYAGGSTNIDGALQKSLEMLTNANRPNYVLFLTDGLPTVGEQNDVKIAAKAKVANTVRARMFNFGVGFDVNSRLLDRLSREQRGQSIYVRPNEDIEAQVATLYNRIASPVLTDLAIEFLFEAKPDPATATPIARTYPQELNDLFRGEQLIWVGRYRKSGATKVKLTGKVGAEPRSFEFDAALVEHSGDETNGFVEKLWALRRIGEILDDLDLNGQNKELVDELVALSIKHGILTPYTSFLADEETDLMALRNNAQRAGDNINFGLRRRQSGGESFFLRRGKAALKTANRLPEIQQRGGIGGGGGFGGGIGGNLPSLAPSADRRNTRRAMPLDGESDSESADAAETVRNIGQKTFFQRDGLWRDSTVTAEQEKQAKKIVQFSTEYFDLAATHGKELGKYLAFRESVLINLRGKTYRIDPPGDAK